MRIKKIVKKLIEEHQTKCPYTIAKRLGIIVIEEALGSINGYFNELMGLKFIHVNIDLSESQKRFVVAHELGHAVLHPSLNYHFLKNHTYFNIDKFEKEANKFAVLLIVDDKQTIDEVNNYNDFDNRIMNYITEWTGVVNNGFSECS